MSHKFETLQRVCKLYDDDDDGGGGGGGGDDDDNDHDDNDNDCDNDYECITSLEMTKLAQVEEIKYLRQN